MKFFKNKNINGMQKFILIWIGQSISTIGTSMTAFALILWIYDQKATASSTALLSFFWILPLVLLSPIAGVVADRYNRKLILIGSDLCAGCMTFIILLLYSTSNLEIWHLYLAQAISGAAGAFQQPAYSSSVATLIPKDRYERASGLRSFSENFSKVMAPILASLILIQFHLHTIMIIDVITCLFAVGSLIFVKLPQVHLQHVESAHKPHIWAEFKISLNYLKERKGLLVLLLLFLSINLIAATTYFGIMSPMILSRSHNSKLVLGTVQAALGIGGVVGSIIVSIWGCPKNRVKSIVITTFLSFLGGDLLFAFGRNVYAWGIGAFLAALFIPFLVAGSFSIWQTKVPPMMQGRIFALRGMLEHSAMPLGYLLGGFLADYYFEPLMKGENILSQVFRPFVGSGNGSGMAVMFFFSCLLGCGSCIIAYLFKDFRHLDELLPDHDATEVAS